MKKIIFLLIALCSLLIAGDYLYQIQIIMEQSTSIDMIWFKMEDNDKDSTDKKINWDHFIKWDQIFNETGYFMTKDTLKPGKYNIYLNGIIFEQNYYLNEKKINLLKIGDIKFGK